MGIYKDRNFTISSITFMVFAATLFGVIMVEPIMLENLFHYTAILAGIMMAPIGLASAVGMVASSILMPRINIKYLLTFALLSCALGSYYMASLNLNAASTNFIIANTLIGLGMGLFIVPLSTYALATVPKSDITEASGLYSYGRMLGTSIGISLLSTLIAREAQINWNRLGEQITPFSNNLRLWLQKMHLTLQSPQALSELSRNLLQQSNMIAYNDAFLIVTLAFLLLIPLILSLKYVSLTSASTGAH